MATDYSDASEDEPQPLDSSAETPILVVGVPRSGTTWVSRVLTVGYNAQFINEPDSEHQDPFALKAKLDLGRFPVLARNEQAPFAYAELWDRAFGGFRPCKNLRTTIARRMVERGRKSGELARLQCWREPPSLRLRIAATLARAPSERRSNERLVIKTVHAPLAVEWVEARRSTRIVVVTRRPLNVIASWLDLGYRNCRLDRNAAVLERFGSLWNLRPPEEAASELTRVTWEIGLLMSAIQVGVTRHPEWIETTHEELCLDLSGGFRRLFRMLGLRWSSRVDDYLRLSDRPGDDPSSTYRVARDQPQRWRRTFGEQQVDEVTRVLSEFPYLGFDSHGPM